MIKLVQNTAHRWLLWAFGFNSGGKYLDQPTYNHTNSDTGTAVNRNKVLLLSSKHATCFGRAVHPQALQFKTQNNSEVMYVF